MDMDAGIGMDTDMDMDMEWTCFASIFSQLSRNSDYRLSEKDCDSRTRQEAVNVHISRKIEKSFRINPSSIVSQKYPNYYLPVLSYIFMFPTYVDALFILFVNNILSINVLTSSWPNYFFLYLKTMSNST
jgi:hypothetical protein